MSKSIGRRFGGFGLDRMLADFETVIDDTAAAEAAPEPEAGAEPGAVEAQPEALDAPPFEIDWDNPSVQEHFAQIADARLDARLRAQQESAAQDAPDPAAIDIFDEGGVANFLDAIDQRLDAKIAPVLQAIEERQQAEAEAVADKQVLTMTSAAGLPETALPSVKRLARSYYGELAERYGNERGASMAFNQAISDLAEIHGQGTKAGSSQETTTLANLATASRELPGGGAAITRTPIGEDEDAVARRWGAVV